VSGLALFNLVEPVWIKRQMTGDFGHRPKWLPVLDSMEVIRIVRSPGVFPRPNLPFIILTTPAQRSSVVQTSRAGAH
jgi:hypothetical protein